MYILAVSALDYDKDAFKIKYLNIKYIHVR